MRATKQKKAPAVKAPTTRALKYKVLELSHVDDASIERAVNEWVSAGWAFDGVQFAMRDSSKRPAMAFLFFTREGENVQTEAPPQRLAFDRKARTSDDAWARLAALAEDSGGET